MWSEENIFRLEDVVFAYEKEKPVLKGVSLEIRKGETTAVLGANGCGKSTLFHLMCGTLKPSGGRILLEGRPVQEIPRKQFAQKVAIVHQYNVAPDDLTVAKLVGMGRTPYHNMFAGRNTAEDRDSVARALEVTDTAKYAQRPVKQLSGGQRQRVWLAMALAQGTEVLLLDEITTYLDVYYQLQLLRLISQLQKEYDLTVVMVLHDINQAMQFTTRSVLMKDGLVLADGPTGEVVSEENLLETFSVETEIRDLDGRRYCIFK